MTVHYLFPANRPLHFHSLFLLNASIFCCSSSRLRLKYRVSQLVLFCLFRHRTKRFTRGQTIIRQSAKSQSHRGSPIGIRNSSTINQIPNITTAMFKIIATIFIISPFQFLTTNRHLILLIFPRNFC